MYTLSNVIIWAGTGIILISFIAAIFISQNNRVYMKWFFLYPLVALLVSINSICGSLLLLYPVTLFFTIQSTMVLLDLFFWYYFFYMILNNKKDRNKLKILLFITLFIAFYLLLFNNVDKRNLHIAALSAICKTVFCIFFFYKIFKNLYYKDILKEPAFWIVTGLIFCSCLSLPFYGLHSYIKSQFSPLIASNIFSVSNILIIIMHLFFFKAYLCTIRVHKV